MINYETECNRGNDGYRCSRVGPNGRVVLFGTAALQHPSNRYKVDPEDGHSIEGEFNSLGDALQALEEHHQEEAYLKLLQAQAQLEDAQAIVDAVGIPVHHIRLRAKERL